MKINTKIILVPAIILLVWQIINFFSILDTFLFPGPIETFMELFKILSTHEIYIHILATIKRVFISFSLALLIGLPLGLLLGYSRKTYEKFEFVIDFFRSIPVVIIFPLFMLIFGLGDNSKIAVTIFGVSLIILFNTAYGVIHSKKSRVIAAKLMGASKFQIFKNVLFWESLPQSFIGIKSAISFSLIIIILTEMFAGTFYGIGKAMLNFQYVYNVSGMYAIIILTGIIGYLLNFIFIILEKKIIHWTQK